MGWRQASFFIHVYVTIEETMMERQYNQMNPLNAPLYEAIKKHLASAPRSFHVPGHHYGQAMKLYPKEITDDLQAVMKLDVTELSSTDDLHDPQGAIKEAQQLAAETYGSEQTFFLIGGSTAGNMALVLAHCNAGDVLIVQRNVHKSIIHAMMLAGARAVFVQPEVDIQSGIATIPSLNNVEEALQRYPYAKAVMLSTPNYYGMGVRLHQYVRLVHAYSIPLLVDEAHGAHYGLHSELPEGALAAGVDGVVQSTHKTLPAMTMGAMLHIQGKYINGRAVKRILSIIQSSSPSYPIMISLDLTRAMIDAYGAQLFEQAIRTANNIRNRISRSVPEFGIVNAESGGDGCRYLDPLRIVLWDRTGTRSGYRLQQELEHYGCYTEMADPRHVVLLIGVASTDSDADALIHACQTIARTKVTDRANFQTNPASFPCGLPVSEPIVFVLGSDHSQDRSETIPLAEAEGRVCDEMIIPYPPGIPILYPGERIGPEVMTTIVQLAEHGAKFQTASDSTLQTIRVVQGS
ncbi:aminotransferase class I/II-fold pyridoxal phosphate-dependent enzyme [Paenibacillus tarimensis]